MPERKECKNLAHDFKHAIRKGRANYVCPVCGHQLMMLLLFMYEAGIDPQNDFDCTVPQIHAAYCACAIKTGKALPQFNYHSEFECRRETPENPPMEKSSAL